MPSVLWFCVLPTLPQPLCVVLLQELPEQVYLHPPLSIFVVEKRAFGRTVLVGTHIVSDVMKFSPRELEEEETEELPKGELLDEVPVEVARSSACGKHPHRFCPAARQQSPQPRAVICPTKASRRAGWGWRQFVIP